MASTAAPAFFLGLLAAGLAAGFAGAPVAAVPAAPAALRAAAPLDRTRFLAAVCALVAAAVGFAATFRAGLAAVAGFAAAAAAGFFAATFLAGAAFLAAGAAAVPLASPDADARVLGCTRQKKVRTPRTFPAPTQHACHVYGQMLCSP